MLTKDSTYFFHDKLSIGAMQMIRKEKEKQIERERETDRK